MNPECPEKNLLAEYVSGNLPDVPVNGIALSRQDPNTLFVGTDLGVWYTYDGGENWAKFGNTLPNVVVYDIEIDQSRQV